MRNVKSNRLLVISRLVGASGVFACMLAAIVYLLLQVNGTANSFNPANLYIIAALAVVFVAASLALRAVSNRIALESEDDLDTIEVVEDAVDEELDSCDEVAEAIVEVEDEDEGVGDGYAAHLRLTDGADHNVVQHIHQMGDAVLYHNGESQQNDVLIERLVSHELLEQ